MWRRLVLPNNETRKKEAHTKCFQQLSHSSTFSPKSLLTRLRLLAKLTVKMMLDAYKTDLGLKKRIQNRERELGNFILSTLCDGTWKERGWTVPSLWIHSWDASDALQQYDVSDELSVWLWWLLALFWEAMKHCWAVLADWWRTAQARSSFTGPSKALRIDKRLRLSVSGSNLSCSSSGTDTVFDVLPLVAMLLFFCRCLAVFRWGLTFEKSSFKTNTE